MKVMRKIKKLLRKFKVDMCSNMMLAPENCAGSRYYILEKLGSLIELKEKRQGCFLLPSGLRFFSGETQVILLISEKRKNLSLTC